MNHETLMAKGPVECRVRAQCLAAIRDFRAYKKIPPEAFQVWSHLERKGAALLAWRILRALKRSNAVVEADSRGFMREVAPRTEG